MISQLTGFEFLPADMAQATLGNFAEETSMATLDDECDIETQGRVPPHPDDEA